MQEFARITKSTIPRFLVVLTHVWLIVDNRDSLDSTVRTSLWANSHRLRDLFAFLDMALVSILTMIEAIVWMFIFVFVIILEDGYTPSAQKGDL